VQAETHRQRRFPLRHAPRITSSRSSKEVDALRLSPSFRDRERPFAPRTPGFVGGSWEIG
jgi:hypothetical protein